MTDEVEVKDKEVVVPGEIIATGMSLLPGRGTYRVDEKIYAGRLGLVQIEGKVIKLVPLSGAYTPRLNDRIVAKVSDVLISGWRLDINSAYTAVLSMKDATSEFIPRGADLTKYLKLDDYVVCKIINITSQKLVDVTMRGPGLHNLRGGRIVTVDCHKVPRIIGKEGSMVMTIKQATGCNVTVGQNGIIWLDGTPEAEIKAVRAIRFIEENAHTTGLTDKVAEFLKGE